MTHETVPVPSVKVLFCVEGIWSALNDNNKDHKKAVCLDEQGYIEVAANNGCCPSTPKRTEKKLFHTTGGKTKSRPYWKCRCSVDVRWWYCTVIMMPNCAIAMHQIDTSTVLYFHVCKYLIS